MKTFSLTIARVGEKLFDGEAARVILPGAEGRFEVLAGHEPLVSPLSPGTIRVVAADGSASDYDVRADGLAEVSNGQTTILL